MIFSGVFLLIGVIFVIAGAVFMVSGAINRNKGVEVPAVISGLESYRKSDGDIDHDVYVDYIYEDMEFSHIRLNYYSSSMYEGKEISITIDPNDPKKVYSPVFNILFGGIFALVGSVFALIGGTFTVKIVKKKRLEKALREKGYYIDAHIDDAVPTNFRINNRPTYVIRCSYYSPDNRLIYSFTSEHIRFNPAGMLDGGTIRVYVDENDYSKYYVDISEIIGDDAMM